ncbi:MAG: helix-turn-helix domain-containing protein [Gemmataceae bacterium]
MQASPPDFPHFYQSPENEFALFAVQELAEQLCSTKRKSRTSYGLANPLVVHGPTGTGKTHLISALVEHVTRTRPDRIITLLSASDFAIVAKKGDKAFSRDDEAHARETSEEIEELFQSALACDLLVVEDLQHLSETAVAQFVALVDKLQIRGQQMVFTADAGPAQLEHRKGRFPARLASRLACGNVVRIVPLSAPSRREFLKRHSESLSLADEAWEWLAGHLRGSGRELLGALEQLNILAKVHDGPLDLETIQNQFQTQTNATSLTVERIAEKVGKYFRVDTKEIVSKVRFRHVVVPRQVSMYLARKLTPLSLQQIGAFFGRDHSTVSHACHKIEQALETDTVLSGAVDQLQATLQ